MAWIKFATANGLALDEDIPVTHRLMIDFARENTVTSEHAVKEIDRCNRELKDQEDPR